MQQKNVKVTAHPVSGLVVTPSKNNSYGTLRVDSVHENMENGFLNIQRRTAFIRGLIEDLNSLQLKAGQTLPGKIIKRESFTPFYEGQKEKRNPRTNEVILTSGKPTFIEYVYTQKENAYDEWVGISSTTMVEEKKDALLEQAI